MDEHENLYVRTNLPDTNVMYSYLLSFGSDVEALEPDYIRKNMKKKLFSMLKNIKHDVGCQVIYDML